MKMNWDMVNDVTYKYAKLCYEILCIVGYIKIKNMIKIVDLKYTDLDVCYFLCSSKYKVFAKIFCTLVG
jgi:hypothetical protein